MRGLRRVGIGKIILDGVGPDDDTGVVLAIIFGVGRVEKVSSVFGLDSLQAFEVVLIVSVVHPFLMLLHYRNMEANK